MKEKHKQAFMDMAFRFAECSTATRLKVGALCIKDDRIISLGYNGMPASIQDENGNPSIWDNICEDENNTTLPEVLHAELNMIAKIAKYGENSNNSTVFVTHSPCLECSKLLYQSGIKKVYYRHSYRKEDGINFLKKCKIEVEQI